MTPTFGGGSSAETVSCFVYDERADRFLLAGTSSSNNFVDGRNPRAYIVAIDHFCEVSFEILEGYCASFVLVYKLEAKFILILRVSFYKHIHNAAVVFEAKISISIGVVHVEDAVG